MATSFLKVSNFSSHRVKFVRGMTEEMQQIIDTSRIVLDQVPAPPAMTLDVVRPARDQIQEELRRCHKQLTPDESGEAIGLLFIIIAKAPLVVSSKWRWTPRG